MVGPTSRLERALDLLEDAEQIDGAMLDISLAGKMIYPATDLLAKRGVPFLFATGSQERDQPDAQQRTCLDELFR